MYRKILQSTVIDQERRAVKLFLLLLVTVVFTTDLFLANVFKLEQAYLPLLAYASLLPASPFVLWHVRKGNPRAVKYVLFLAFTVANFCLDIAVIWDKGVYYGGNIAEIYFILFSPIFVNQRYCYSVILLTVIKYLLVAVLLDTVLPLGAIGLIAVFSVVAMIIFHRFHAYLSAVNASLIDQFETVVSGIISTIELKDPYTRGHSQRVAEYARILAEALNIFGQEELKMIHHACLLHDVGKIHVPDHILSKPDKLTDEEFAIVKKHPEAGAEAIRNIQGAELFRNIVLHHHERWDGKGYPAGLRASQIPLAARIAALADAFDAMTSDRSYRMAMSPEEALDEIRRGKGTQFDPALVEYVEKVFPEWRAVALQNRGNAVREPAARTARAVERG